jgi:hypothetical protein
MPRAPFDYLMQIATFLVFVRRVARSGRGRRAAHRYQANGQLETLRAASIARRENAPWSVGQAVGEHEEYHVEFANFGSDGTRYVFIDRQATPPRALLFWNR